MSSYGEDFSYSSYLYKNVVGQTQNKNHSKLGFLYFSAWGVIRSFGFFMQLHFPA